MAYSRGRPNMDDHTAAPDQTEAFRDPTNLTNWTRGLLYTSIAFNAHWIWMDWRGYQAITSGGSAPQWPLWTLSFFIPIALSIPIIVLTWIHRANANVRALGATGLKFTPGWAVGWYFVPVAFFWKPFQAMREIWRASVSPADWSRQPGSSIIGWWWALWIVVFFALEGVTAAAEGFDLVSNPEVLKARVDIASGLIDIPLTLILIVIVGRVHRMQMAHHRRQLAAN